MTADEQPFCVENVNIDAAEPGQMRDEHIERYRWAAESPEIRGIVLDLGCGYGYGSAMLACASGRAVLGVDRDLAAITYARDHYSARLPCAFVRSDLESWPLPNVNAIVCCEVLEHLRNPWTMLWWMATMSPVVFLSVPIIPTTHRNRFHLHDFTIDEIRNRFADWVCVFERVQNGHTCSWLFQRPAFE